MVERLGLCLLVTLAMTRQDFSVEVTEMPGHTHDYYGRSGEIDKGAWLFLSSRQLDEDPHYQDFVVRR